MTLCHLQKPHLRTVQLNYKERNRKRKKEKPLNVLICFMLRCICSCSGLHMAQSLRARHSWLALQNKQKRAHEIAWSIKALAARSAENWPPYAHTCNTNQLCTQPGVYAGVSKRPVSNKAPTDTQGCPLSSTHVTTGTYIIHTCVHAQAQRFKKRKIEIEQQGRKQKTKTTKCLKLWTRIYDCGRK